MFREDFILEEKFQQNNSFSVEIIKINKEMGQFLKWLTSKKNANIIYDTENSEKAKSYFSFLISLNFHLYDSEKYCSDFYVIYQEKKSISYIMSIKFYTNVPHGKFHKILNSLYSDIYESRNASLKKIKKITIFVPFTIGTTFEKQKWIHEINAYHMETFMQTENLNRKRYLTVKGRSLNKQQVMLNEYFQNNSMQYNQDYAYCDFLKIFRSTGDLPTDSLNELDDVSIVKLLDTLDSIYMNAILIQQEDVIRAIRSQIKIVENVKLNGNVYSPLKLLYRLRKELKRNFNGDEYKEQLLCINKLIKKVKKAGNIHKISSNIKNNCEKYFFDNVQSKYIYFNNVDYKQAAIEHLNKNLPSSNSSTDLSELADLIFGSESILYEKNDKKKNFFSDVKKNFYIFHKNRYRTEHLNVLLNIHWTIDLKKAIEKAAKLNI